MTPPTSKFYTNEVSPDFLRTLDKSTFTEQQLSTFNEQALATIKQQQEYKKSQRRITARGLPALYRKLNQKNARHYKVRCILKKLKPIAD